MRSSVFVDIDGDSFRYGYPDALSHDAHQSHGIPVGRGLAPAVTAPQRRDQGPALRYAPSLCVKIPLLFPNILAIIPPQPAGVVHR